MTLVAALWILSGVVVCLALYVAVARDEIRRDSTADGALWSRDLDEYRRRAQQRQADSCAGRLRQPLPRRIRTHDLN